MVLRSRMCHGPAGEPGRGEGERRSKPDSLLGGHLLLGQMRRCPDRYEVGLEPQDTPSADDKQQDALHNNLAAARECRVSRRRHEKSVAWRHIPQTEDR
jgi:hypothetical protein